MFSGSTRKRICRGFLVIYYIFNRSSDVDFITDRAAGNEARCSFVILFLKLIMARGID